MSVRVEFANLEGIKDFERHIQEQVDAELQASVLEIVYQAKQNAPESHGHLRNNITYAKLGELQYEVFVDVDYALYVEFGTRDKVKIPPGWQAVAAQAQGTGRVGNLSAKDAIFLWCQREGIDEKYWYAIYVTIMTVGINPHPFFVPAFEDEKQKFAARFKNITGNE
jgi:HK97 gp10 family phage protein